VSALAALFMRDMRLAVRVGGGAGIGVLFFLIVVVLVPFAIGPDLALLARIGPAIMWLGALLASLLTLDRLFAADHEDGSLDLLMTTETPLELAVGAKALAHWLTTGLPLVVATPLLGLLMNLDARTSAAVALTLLAGTPALTFIGLVGAALSVALRRRGLQCRDHRPPAVRHAVHDPVRADAGQPCGWHIRRRRGPSARPGVTVEPRPPGIRHIAPASVASLG
jgi:heme exporter protein B